MDPRERNESAASGCSSLGLLRSDAMSDLSGMSGYNSSASSVFMALAKEDEEEGALEETLDEEKENNSLHSDFEPTPKAFRSIKHQDISQPKAQSPHGLPANLLVPSESTPNTPTNNPCALPSSVQRLLQSLVNNASVDTSADNSNLSWEKLFGGGAQGEKEPPSFCTGQFSARSTSFGTTNSSSAASSREEVTQNERFSDYTHRPSTMMSHASNVHYSKENPFGEASGDNVESGCFFESAKFDDHQKQDQEDFAQEEFRSLDSQFIDDAEKENNEKYRFIQEQTMSSDVTNPGASSKHGFSQCFNNTTANASSDDHLSRSQYFMMNTSRLGNSICNATDDSSRPNLGFGTIKSPKLKPRPLMEKSLSSQGNSTFSLSDVSSGTPASHSEDVQRVCKKLSLPDSEHSLSINDSKVLEEALKNKLSSDGQLDLNFISMLMNNSGGEVGNPEGKKGSAEYLVSMILKTLEVSGQSKKLSSSSMDMSTVSGALPSFLEMSSNTSHDSSKTLPSKSRKKSHYGARHSSPIRSQSASRLDHKLKIQPINSVIKSSKSVDNDPNLSIVVMESLKKQDSSPAQLQVLTREGDKIDFGILPEDCSTTEDLVLVHNGQHDQEIRLEIQGQLPSFIYPTDGQTKYIKIISSKNIILTLPAISLSTTRESLACSIKISIHTPASGSQEIKTLQSQVNILCDGKLLAQVPMVARVGQVKLQTLKSSKIPILNCSPSVTWYDHLVPMLNVGNIQMTISLELGASSLGQFKLEQSVMILQPNKEYLAHLKFQPTELGEEEIILRCTVQPNGTTYEVPIKVSSKLDREAEKENNAKFPVVQLGKLSAQPSPRSKNPFAESKNSSVNKSKEAAPFVFPVEADKSFMNWIAVPVGTSEEQVLTLKNALSESIAVTLVVRDSELFKVKIKETDEYKRSLDIESLAGNGTLSIRVAFQPNTLTKTGSQLEVGKLIIKPRLGTGGKIYKATIGLQGNAGAPEFTFSGFGDEVNGKQSLFLGQLSDKLIVKTLSIRNKGSGPGFVTCLALGNNGALSDAIRFENTESVVLYPNESAIFRFSVDSRKVPMGDKNQVFVGFIHVYTGSELARSAMRRAIGKLSPSVKLKIQSSAFGGGVLASFESEFKGERESFNGSVSYLDVKNFYKNSRKMVVELSGICNPKDETLLKFNALPIEETLSESRMDNTNYGGNTLPLVHHPHSPPTRCSSISEEGEEESTAFKVFEIHDEDIFIESRKTVLVTLINLTNEAQRFDLGWPAHILMVQPSSGVVKPRQRETIAITAIAQEKRKGLITVHTALSQEASQAISFAVLPLKFTVEPDKIKFAHPGTEMRLSLKNHTDQMLSWEVKESDPNFIISQKRGELVSKGSVDFTILYQPLRPGGHVEKTICFLGKAMPGGSPTLSALLEVSGGQLMTTSSSSSIPLQSLLVSPSDEVQTPKRSVYLDKESISFSPTRVGEHSTVKVIVKNRLNTAQTFNVESLPLPFSTKYTETPIVIKPMSYLGFPVTFAPINRGDFKQNIVLRNNHKILVGILTGTAF